VRAALRPCGAASAGPVRTYAAEAGGKYVRSKPHMNIGTIGHVGT